MIAEMLRTVDEGSPTIDFFVREIKNLPADELTKMLDPWTSMARCFQAGRNSFTRGELHATTLAEAVEFIIKEHEQSQICSAECQSVKLEIVDNPTIVAWLIKLLQSAVSSADPLVALQGFAYIYRAGLIVGRSRAMRERVFGDGLDEATDGTPE